MLNANFKLHPELRCKTSGWHNNCGLNCLSHFLITKLNDGDVEGFYGDDPAYTALRETFAEYYGLPSVPRWDEIKKVLESYRVATDQEAILAPVLRKHLGKQILENAPDIWENEGAVAFNDYLARGRADDVGKPIVASNRPWFERLKAEYTDRVARAQRLPVTADEQAQAFAQLIDNRVANPLPGQILLQIQLQRKNAIIEQLHREAKEQWLNGACHVYAEHMADLEASEEISFEHLSLLGERLHMGFEVNTRGMRRITDPPRPWMVKIFNTGAHWEYETPTKSAREAAMHNFYYTEEFLQHADLSPFKTWGPQAYEPGLPQRIIAQIYEDMRPVAPTVADDAELAAVFARHYQALVPNFARGVAVAGGAEPSVTPGIRAT